MKKLATCLLAGSLLSAFGFRAEAAVDAKKLYEGKCASCHSKDGKGNPNMAKMFKVDRAALDFTDKATLTKKDEELTGLIVKGKGKMPAFKGKLKEGEIKSLVAYLRSLAAGPVSSESPKEKPAQASSGKVEGGR